MNKLKIMAAAFAAMLCLCACDDAKPIKDSVAETVPTEEPTVAETIEEATEPEVNDVINPLTGEGDYNENAVGKRPVAVMVSNIKAALPQYGIDEADIIYEIPVEGGITRLMAIYADYTDVPDICSVRSCRYYYPRIAYGMDAIYCHWGSDKTIAQDTLDYLGIDRFDGGNGKLGYGTVFVRDEERAQTYDTEHTGALKGSELPAQIEELGYRTDINEENADGAFNFNPQDEPVEPVGDICPELNLNFSNAYYSTFKYDEAEQVYYKYHSGNEHKDGVTGNQLSFTNIFVLETSVSTRSDGKLKDIGLDGGEGYYVSMGKAQEITWEKESDIDPIKIYDESGEEITVNAGKSYIGMIDGDNVELYDDDDED